MVVPLDAQSPPERRGHILTDSAAVALIHADTAPEGLPDGVRALPLAALLAHRAAPEAPFTGSPVSFLFYTSGTTGLPKGVEVTESGVLRLARPGYIELEQGARYSCMSNPAFDALNFEVWAPLLTGGCCVILDDADVQTPDRLAAALLRERIDTLFVTVALFNAVVDAVPDCFAGVGQVLVGGEQLNARVIRRWYRHNADSPTRLHNVYGPTETATFALCHPIPGTSARMSSRSGARCPTPGPSSSQRVPTGRPYPARSPNSTWPEPVWQPATATCPRRRDGVSSGCPGTTTAVSSTTGPAIWSAPMPTASWSTSDAPTAR